MQNIIKNNQFRNILSKKKALASLNLSKQFTVCAILQIKEKYFMEIPEGLVPEPENKKIIEDKASVEYKRNKSGLRPHHYRKHHTQDPDYTDDEKETMKLSKYRELYGYYGNSANIELKALWPSKYELELMKERERIEFPHTVEQMINIAREKRLQEEKETMDRQNTIVKNMKSLESWKKGVVDRMEKKELEAKQLLEDREKQIEEVREVLGYKISPHDPKFQEILEKKLEEDKKKAKKERKLKRQQLEIQRLTEMVQKEAKEAEEIETMSQDSLQGKKIE